MKNIIYNTTRQWNCGDEFILMGTINLLKNTIGEHNAIIYNRNPDIRPENGTNIWYRNYKLAKNYKCTYGALFRYGFHDNSIKFNSDMSYADIAVFAGSPEWLSSRCENFYHHILKNDIPVLILGVGWFENPPDFMKEVISKSLLLTVRDKAFLDAPLMKIYNAVYQVCPALFAVPIDKEKNITEVNTIGLNYQTNFSYSVRANCIEDNVHEYCVNLFKQIIKTYSDKKIYIICHYIDELYAAHSIFKDENVEILYSYDSKDYIDIYNKCDLVISTRVHGCGMSSSLGIPNFVIKHDFRASTTDGFLSKEILIDEDFESIKQKIDNVIADTPKINQELISYKKSVFDDYCNLINNALKQKKKHYANVYKKEAEIAIQRDCMLLE